MKKRACTLLLLVAPLIADAQDLSQHQRDSLRAVWNDPTRPDSVRQGALQDIIHDGAYSDPPDSGLHRSRILLAFARQRRLKRLEGTALNLCGIFFNNQNQWDSAEASYLRSLAIWKELGEKGRMAGVYNNLGNVASYKGDQSKAIDYLTRSLRIGEETGDSSVVARALGNIGVCHLEQKDYDVALDYFHRRIVVADAIGDKQCSLEAYICIGMLHDERKERALAREGYTKSLQLARVLNDATSIYTSMANMGRLDVAEGNSRRGLAYLDSSLALAVLHDDPMGQATALTEIARAHHLQGKDPVALPFARRALERARASKAQEVTRDAAEVNYAVLKGSGDHAGALAMYELFIAMRDSLTNDNNKKAVMQQKFQYDYDKKEALLQAEQEKKDALAAEELRRRNLQRNAFIGGFGLMVLLAGTFFFQRNRISKEKQRSEALLLNILPEEVAEELKAKGQADAKHFDNVTILFTDFKGFTQISEQVTPAELVAELNACFKAFDGIMGKYRIEKIKTIGDAYMAAGGLPDPQHGSPADVIRAALEMQDFMERHKAEREAAGKPYFEMRVGIHTGPVVAGIVGVKKFQYDIWGDTVNTASRMESSGEVGRVNISQATYRLVNGEGRTANGAGGNSLSPTPVHHSPAFTFTPRGKVQAKGKGEMEMYFVERKV